MDVDPISRYVTPKRQLSAGGLVWTAGLAALLVVITQTTADTDLWGHVRFGQDIMAAGQIPAIDHYSFTSDRAWINHEWLAEVFMGTAYRVGGAVGLVALKMSLAIVAVLFVAGLLRQRLRPGWYRAALLAATILAGVAPLTGSMRPQVFSLVLFAALLCVLATAECVPRRLWWLPPMFAAWVNLHGGWLVGLGVLSVWSAGRLLETRSWPWLWRLATVCLCSVAATLVNPYGLELWRFMSTTVGVERADIVEWQSLTLLPILLLPWGLTSALALWAAWRAPRIRAARLGACGLLALMAFLVARLAGFYTLAVVVLLASRVSPDSPRRVETTAAMPLGAALLIGGFVVVLGLAVQGPALACLRSSAAVQLDPAAGAYLRANDLSGRLLVWFNWGEYAIWHLAPRLQVSMDGRRETVYSQSTIDAHIEFYRNGPTARSYLQELDPDYIWLPRELPVSSQLPSWGWQPLFETPDSIVWLPPGRDVPDSTDAPPLSACFPGR